MPSPTVSVSQEEVRRLWLWRQGLSAPRGAVPLESNALVDHLTRTGALQLDSINVADRAHYLTLWSRFGVYDKAKVDAWIYDERAAYEYWGHEASILPIAHLALGLRRMRRFPPDRWRNAAWWERFNVTPAAKRRVLKRLRAEGPLESIDFEARPSDKGGAAALGLPKEDKRTLQVLWHAGRVAVRQRRHFRRVYDLAERVYPKAEPASITTYDDSWLLIGLSGNGIASEKHLLNYWTGPHLKAETRKRVLTRNIRSGRVREVKVPGFEEPFYALPAHLDMLSHAPEPVGTTFICPFDSLLWQRRRAEDLLGFRYRVEIYVPLHKRVHGYYVLPILHDGRLVGRLDPKMHRKQCILEIRNAHLEPGFEPHPAFEQGLRETLASLASFLGARDIHVPPGWKHLA